MQKFIHNKWDPTKTSLKEKGFLYYPVVNFCAFSNFLTVYHILALCCITSLFLS